MKATKPARGGPDHPVLMFDDSPLARPVASYTAAAAVVVEPVVRAQPAVAASAETPGVDPAVWAPADGTGVFTPRGAMSKPTQKSERLKRSMSSQELEEDQWGWGLFGEQYDFPDGSRGRVVRFGRMFRESYMGVAKIVDAVEMEGSSHRASRRVVMEDPTREGFIRSAKKLPDGRVMWNVDVVELPAVEIAIPAIKVQLQKRGIDLKEVMARGERIHLAHRDRQRPTIA